jgi:hypothetical protein
VDRFSDKAGTLLKRSADKRLPGPNEPIDFNSQPLNTLGLSPKGEPVLYYHLDVQSNTPAPLYILYREGQDKPMQGQLDIIDTVPGEKGYIDFRQVWKVWMPKNYIANTIADAATLLQAGYKTEKTDKLLNIAVVPDKSRARVRFKGGNSELQRAWYQNQVARFFLFDEAPLSVSGDKVPVSPIYDGFTINPGNQAAKRSSAPIPHADSQRPRYGAGDKTYSPLWLRVVYASAACDSVHNLDTALNAKVVPADVLLINLPRCLDRALDSRRLRQPKAEAHAPLTFHHLQVLAMHMSAYGT